MKEGNIQPVCRLDDCTRVVYGHGFCSMHYQRWRRTGDPLKVRVCHPDPYKALAKRWPTRTPEERFWEKVQKGDQCWVWSAGLDAHGYGQLAWPTKHGKTMIKAHRLMYQLAYGQLQSTDCVLHKCDNPACVRPDHLFLGNRHDNSIDMAQKGRWANQFQRGPAWK